MSEPLKGSRMETPEWYTVVLRGCGQCGHIFENPRRPRVDPSKPIQIASACYLHPAADGWARKKGDCDDRCRSSARETSSILGLDQVLGVDLNALADAFQHAESDPMRALAAVAAAREAADAVEAHALRAGRRKRMPWAKLAVPLGITRQALQKRHADLD